MGSGPSVNELNWENLDYDGIVTCNNFLGMIEFYL